MKFLPVPAVVLGMFETGLGVIHSLAQRGVPVLAMDIQPLCARYSRYARSVICPNPRENEDAFVQFVKTRCERMRAKPLVFVTSDAFIEPVARRREEFQTFCRLNLPSLELLEQITDKYQFHRLAQQCGLLSPATACLDCSANLQDQLEGMQFPLILKGRDVLSWRQAVGSTNKAIVVQNIDELDELCRDPVLKRLPIIAQELIPGPDTAHWKFCGYMSQRGELLCGFSLQKIRQQPVGRGVGSCVESRFNPRVVELGESFFRRTGYRGVGSVEFKCDERTGEYKVIELNPRFWQQNSLAAAAGADFAWVQYLDLLNQPVSVDQDFQEGIRWVNLHRDFEAFRLYRRRNELSLGGWLLSLRRPLIVSDFVWYDPLPFIASLDLRGRARHGLRAAVQNLRGYGARGWGTVQGHVAYGLSQIANRTGITKRL